MAQVRKNLGGGLLPAAATDTTLYTVPAATDTVVADLIVCNQGAATTFRVAWRVAGAALTGKQYLFYDCPIDANDTLALGLGITMAATDVLTVRSASGSVSFNASGAENS
jgi:hypothetical protein